MPEALISRITSLGPGVGSGNSLSSSLRSPRNTTPFMAASDARVLTSPPMTVYEMRTRKFADDADRRAHWAAVYANQDFVEGFATAPWGPHP